MKTKTRRDYHTVHPSELFVTDGLVYRYRGSGGLIVPDKPLWDNAKFYAYQAKTVNGPVSEDQKCWWEAMRKAAGICVPWFSPRHSPALVNTVIVLMDQRDYKLMEEFFLADCNDGKMDFMLLGRVEVYRQRKGLDFKEPAKREMGFRNAVLLYGQNSQKWLGKYGFDRMYEWDDFEEKWEAQHSRLYDLFRNEMPYVDGTVPAEIDAHAKSMAEQDDNCNRHWVDCLHKLAAEGPRETRAVFKRLAKLDKEER